MASKIEPIPLKTALSRLVELAEFEIASPACPDPPPGWQSGLVAAVKETKAFLAEIREPAGEFFTSAAERPHKLSKLNGSNQTKEPQAMLNNRNKVVRFLGEARTKSLEQVLEAISKAADEAGIEKKEVGEAARQAAYLAALDVLLEQMDQLIGQFYGSPVAGKSKKFDLLAHLKEVSERNTQAKKTGPTKAVQPAGPLFADNRSGLGEALHRTGSFDATLVKAAAEAKSRNFNNGGTKR